MVSTHNKIKRASQIIIQKAKGPKWKRELVPDHKFDFIDIEEFREHSFMLVIRYFILLCSVIISFLVYGADLWSAAILLIYDKWSLSTQPEIPFYISKWIYVACIALSFMLLAWEIRKTRSVMATRDISMAVTNPLAYQTYAVKSYSYFCLLRKIKSSTRWSDVVIFYVFYTLKGWKKIIIAQGPRQIIAGITVYALLKSAWTDKNSGGFRFSDDWDTYGKDWQQRLTLILMSFTCILWILSMLLILFAVFLYFPVLCQIQGNLKEYCCHKIDKRIDELLQKQRKERIRQKEKAYNNSNNSLKTNNATNRKGGDESHVPLPTLPNVDLYHASSENLNNPWPYQHAQEQQYSSYYDSQPMSPLESSYSLQRNPTNKYSPYIETTNHQIHQPVMLHTVHPQRELTANYYYHQQQQDDYDTSPQYYDYNNTSASQTYNSASATTDYDTNLTFVSRSNTIYTESTNTLMQTTSFGEQSKYKNYI
ncbi:MAG: hypothetical protein EXX96DRAFT_648776 [Benjaminiella poitrasii]|nr:MAG: hypothetical protein EXX96DRAFT_648776 [Benjaminiella poitrasii]